MQDSPLVSVLMTAFNREAFIASSIESVLNSIYPNFELIIVDDCSKDNTVAVAGEYMKKDNRVHVYVNETNLGDYSNRNKAASYAKGKYIKYVDSDDLMYPYCLYMMVKCMEQYPEAGYGLSAVGNPDAPYPLCVSPKEAYMEHFGGYGHFDRAPGSAIIKKEVFDAVGGFSGKRMIGDYELWLKLSMKYSMVKMPRDLFWDRRHAGQESQSGYSKQYADLKQQVLNEALSNKDCPLSKVEIDNIMSKVKKKAMRDKVMQTLARIVR